MKIYTQNIFKYATIKTYGITKTPTKIWCIEGVSKRTKLGKFLNNLESILNGESCTIAILDYNKYGYVSFIIELDDKFEEKRVELEKIGYRSNY